MNIFLPIFDLYRNQGGGETIYRQIISLMKDCTFYYFLEDEPQQAERPGNTVGVPYQPHYFNAKALKPAPYYLYDNFLQAMNMSKSLSVAFPGMRFDIVDVPDYQHYGIFLGHALKHHGLDYGRIMLALHGTMSHSVKSNWASTSKTARSKRLARLRILEGLQYQLVDHRYAISEAYAARWDKHYRGLSCTIIDPLVFMDIPETFPPVDPDAKPDIYYIGRKERTKGPDIFIDLIWFLPKHLYRRAMLIGAEDPTGQGSVNLLSRAAALRGVSYTNLPSQSREKIFALLQQKAINVITSRYETLSLSALESLVHGCPTVISRYCGIVPYLKKHYPSIPFYEIDLSCARDGVKQLEYVIENYASERAKLIAAIQALPPLDKPAAIRAIYTSESQSRAKMQPTIAKLFTEFTAVNERASLSLTHKVKRTLQKIGVRRLKKIVKKRLSNHLALAQEIKGHLSEHSKGKLLHASLKSIARHMFKDPKAMAQWYFALSAKRRKSALQPKTNDIPATITRLEDLTTYRHVDRAPYYQALSALEKARENPLIAAVYAARLLRWQDQQQAMVDIAGTLTALQTKGYHAEAEALQAIYGEHGSAEQQLAYLQNKLASHKHKPELPLEILDDRRAKPRYKVSVIVSLYNAASKLPTFFRMLDQQTLIKQDEIEVVLIDSGSPADEYSAFKHYQGPLKNAVVFARSEKRETIQAAWNRGIKLCRGEYMTFQAVDEALHPECLTILSDELDKNPDVDWIMGSAIVAEINKQEILLSDVMTYNRSDAKQHSPILDGTYVNYTPGLYRKRVHELHGYYDESFAAAGDTEFKNRVLPFITLKFIPDVLGAYNNYQEERTTAHPRAEIEDIRAWYLFRTPAGIEYLFQNKSETALLDLLRDTLGYRKAYCTHLSTDIELGLSVATYLHKKTGNVRYQTWVNQFQQLIALCRQVESLPTDKPAIMTMIRATGTFTQIKKRLGRELKLAKLPAISLFHDNRYEQHWWPWRNTI